MGKEKEREKRKPTFVEAITPIIFMAVVLVVGKGILNWPTEVCLLIAAAFAGIIAVVRLGYNWTDLEKLIVDKISAVMPPVLIVIFVGFMIGAWCYAGTLPMLVYYGMKFISPNLILFIAFVATAILSYVSGASWGAAASIGVALMGVGNGLGVPAGMTAAAVVTGAYFGDKLSPLSDTTNLASAVTRVPLYDHIKYMLWTTVPSTVITLIFLLILGFGLGIDGEISPSSMTMLSQLSELFKFGILPLIPMLVILIATFLRFPTVPAMLISAVSAILIGALYQGFDLASGLQATMTGFNVSMIGADPAALEGSVIELLNRGGLANNGSFLAFIFCAMGFAGIVTGTGMMDKAIGEVTHKIKSCGQAVLTSEVMCIIINLLTGSDGLNKIITTELLMKKFLELRIHPIVLCRSLEDSGTMTGPIIPWSAAGLYMATTLGVPTMEYFPYCLLCFLSLLFGLLYAFTGFKIKRITDEEAYKMAEERGIVLDK